MDRWKDRVALVTGATSGIGEATARALAAAGMRVAFSGRRTGRLDALAEDLTAGGAEVLPVAADLRDETQIARMFKEVRQRWGGVDVLVNNAGLGRRASLIEAPSAPWREMLEVNVLALCICTREAIADMRRRGDDGHVIHISSMAAHRVPRGSGVYSATKFAVRALTEALRQELRELESAIRVSAVSPGFVETEFAAGYHGDPAAAKQTYGRYPVLQPEDIASAVVYLLGLPQYAQVHDLLIRPTRQES